VWNNIHATFVHNIFIVRPFNDHYSRMSLAGRASGNLCRCFLKLTISNLTSVCYFKCMFFNLRRGI